MTYFAQVSIERSPLPDVVPHPISLSLLCWYAINKDPGAEILRKDRKSVV